MLLILGYYCLLYWLCLHIFQINLTLLDFLKLALSSIITFGIIILGIVYFDYNVILMVLFAVEILIVALYLLLQKKLLANFFFLILSFLIILFAAQTSEVLVYALFKIPYALQESNWKLILSNTILMTIIVLLLAQGLNYLFKHFKVYALLRTHSMNSLGVGSTILLIVIAFFSQIDSSNSNSTTTKVSLLFLLIIVIVGFVSIIWLRSQQQLLQLRHEQETNQQLVEYLSNLEYAQTEFRKFKHDYLNVLAGLTGYIENQDLEGLKNYFYQVVNNNNINQTNDLFNLKSLQNMKIIEVKGLLALKLSKFNQYQNNFRIEIINPIQNLPNAMPIYEYNRCLGILLDNAMEALDFSQIDSSDKKTYLSIVFYQKEQQLVMVIKNRYFQKINLSEIYKSGFTNKKGHQGLGLANINEILQQYPHSSIDTEITPDFFIQKLTLSKV
ncbi:hypothetical protein DS831_03005 [Bombilactobacillus bombi]|uniref:Sensor histidine kinase NatK-like C-terminal domain-containing protein n=1 Tax=Bombilactobacillus bombi TaxID=1303590 RepID=A0A3R6YU96_9LACO|nr:hypothetical protein DS831_03005 [Bombilactobacillus bombi]